MKITAIIPARYGSKRFEGKPLARILGKPMIQWVYEGVSQSKLIDSIIIATDDKRIYECAKSFGAEVAMTSKTHETGTDRIAEVARRIHSEIIVNVQGDEPLIKGSIIDEAIRPLIYDPKIPMGTVTTKIETEEEWFNPNVVKVVLNKGGFALYFSRGTIPFPRDFFLNNKGMNGFFSKNFIYKHIGVYVYRRDFLIKFSKMKPTELEKLEKLEQLRALENGYSIKVVKVNYKPLSVDIPNDIKKIEQFLKKNKKFKSSGF